MSGRMGSQFWFCEKNPWFGFLKKIIHIVHDSEISQNDCYYCMSQISFFILMFVFWLRCTSKYLIFKAGRSDLKGKKGWELRRRINSDNGGTDSFKQELRGVARNGVWAEAFALDELHLHRGVNEEAGAWCLHSLGQTISLESVTEQ